MNDLHTNFFLINDASTQKKEDENSLKIASTAFLVICFLSLKEGFCETRTKCFYFTLKAIFILEKISWYHQMPKH